MSEVLTNANAKSTPDLIELPSYFLGPIDTMRKHWICGLLEQLSPSYSPHFACARLTLLPLSTWITCLVMAGRFPVVCNTTAKARIRIRILARKKDRARFRLLYQRRGNGVG